MSVDTLRPGRLRRLFEDFWSRPRIKNRFAARKPSNGSVGLRPTCITQASPGPVVVPAVSIHRAASSITKKTQILIRPRGANTSTLKKKSAAPADDLTSHREPSPLHDGQSHSSPTQLPLEGGVLLAQVLDGRLMLAGDPAGHGGHEYLPGFENGAHPKPVGDARMNRQRSLRPGSGLN